jgi:subtilisin family serine protease
MDDFRATPPRPALRPAPVLALLAAALLLATSLAAQSPAGLDPALRMALRLGASGVEPVGAGVPGVAVPRAPAADAATARVTGLDLPVLHLDEPLLRLVARVEPGAEAEVRAAGGRIGARAGDVVTLRAPLSALPALAALRGVVYLEAAARLTPAALPWSMPDLTSGPAADPRPGPLTAPAPAPAAAHALSIPAAGADRLRQRVGDRFHGLAGQGVIVGIFDSGLDLEHEDFRRIDGTSRVLFAWDQSVAGAPPGPVGAHHFEYGAECTAALIAAGGCPMVDRVGHGTHVAGTLAGNGRATGAGLPRYRHVGMAPEAELIVVKGGDGSYTGDGLLDAVAYIFARAEQLGRPAVVNLSMGSQQGPHDGSTLLEQALDQLSGPGRIIVAAAGNQGTNANETPALLRAPIHATGVLRGGDRSRHVLGVPPYAAREGELNDAAVLELWYDGRDSLTVVLTTPLGQTFRVATGDTLVVRSAAGGILVDNAATGPQPTNGDHVAYIALVDLDAAVPPAAGAWTIEVEGAGVGGSGRYHLWLVGTNLNTELQLAAFQENWTNSHLVATPATAASVLAVGAWAQRDEWRTLNGESVTLPVRQPLGDIAFFSAPGPRRDGVLKPDLTAPGMVVFSAYAAGAELWRGRGWLMDEDGVHVGNLGTSMSAPHVAGAAALLLQLRPTAAAADLVPLLGGGARRDAFTARGADGAPASEPNTRWGAGKLDVERAVHLLGLPAGELHVTVRTAPGVGAVDAARGTRVELLELAFRAGAREAVAVERLGFRVAGSDTAAALLLLERDSAGTLHEVGRLPLSLTGAPRTASFAPGPVIPAGLERTYVLALDLGGAAPHRSRIVASFEPALLQHSGTLSGAVPVLTGPGAAVYSAERIAELLRPGERVVLSANPVRSGELVLSYESRPRALSIYTVAGRRVLRREAGRLEEGRFVWRLENEDGAPVADGIYFIVLEFDGGSEIRKLFVARGTGATP